MASISGDSIIVIKDYVIEDNSTFKNYIIPSSPSITKSILMILPRTVSENFNCFRIWNYTPYNVILQYRYGDDFDEIYNLFTIKCKALVWLEYSSLNNNFAVVGSKELNDSMILNKVFYILKCLIIMPENRDLIISSKLGATGDDDAWLFISYDDMIFSIIMVISNHTRHHFS